MRALGRFRWVLPALGLPLCILALGVAVQAAVFPRPAPETLVVADALRSLQDFHVMRAVQRIGPRPLASICLDVTLRSPAGRNPIHGALVLLANGERLYSFGKGIHSVGEKGRVEPIDRARFVLAGCPSSLGESMAASLGRDWPVDADRVATSFGQNVAVTFGSSYRPVTLLFNTRPFLPIEVTLRGRVSGSSELSPGASQSAISHLKRTFALGHQTTIPSA